MKKFMPLMIFCLLSLPVAGIGQTGSAGSQYTLLEKVKLGGEGGWDYLTFDTAAHRLYISRSTHVQVLDASKKEVIGADWFPQSAKTIGITAGASTPNNQIGEAIERIAGFRGTIDVANILGVH